MKLFNINILVSSFISILFQLLSYKELSGKKIVISFKKFLLVFLIFWAIILNNAYNFEVLTAPVGLILLILLNMVVFKSNYNIVVNITTVNNINRFEKGHTRSVNKTRRLQAFKNKEKKKLELMKIG